VIGAGATDGQTGIQQPSGDANPDFEQLAALGSRLYTAAQQGDTKQVRELLMSRAPVNFLSADANDETALIVASQNGHEEIVSILIDFGASKDVYARVCSLLAGAHFFMMAVSH